MELKDKLLTVREFRVKRKELGMVLTRALTRDEYFDGRGGAISVPTPKDIREAYFDLFMNLVDKSSIQHGFLTHFPLDLRTEAVIPLVGRDLRGSNFVLSYNPQSVDLEVSSYLFNGQGDEIREIGRVSTHLNGDGNFQTGIRVGDTFAYKSGFKANHSFSRVIDLVQNLENIPKIPKSELEANSIKH